MVIAVMAGQKSLGSGRDSICSDGPFGEDANVRIGNTIKANTQAATVTAPYLSNIGADFLDRPTFQNLPEVAPRHAIVASAL
jgi:hypothetical protein